MSSLPTTVSPFGTIILSYLAMATIKKGVRVPMSEIFLLTNSLSLLTLKLNTCSLSLAKKSLLPPKLSKTKSFIAEAPSLSIETISSMPKFLLCSSLSSIKDISLNTATVFLTPAFLATEQITILALSERVRAATTSKLLKFVSSINLGSKGFVATKL